MNQARLYLSKTKSLGWIFECLYIQSGDYGLISINKITEQSKIDDIEFEQLELKKIIPTLEFFLEKNIYKKFCKPNTFNQLDYFKNLPIETFDSIIRPYLEKRINQVFNFCLENHIPIYIRDSKEISLQSSSINFCTTKLTANFYIIKTGLGLEYQIICNYNNNQIQLRDVSTQIFCFTPCWILNKNTLYCFENSINGKKIQPFVKLDKIFVPKKLEEQFFKTFLIQIVKDFEVNATGYNVKNIKIKPIAKLNIDKNWKDQYVYVLSFIYDDVEFMFHDYKKSKVKLIKDKENYSFEKYVRNNIFENNIIDLLGSINIIQSEGSTFKIDKADLIDNSLNSLIQHVNNNYLFLKENKIKFEETYYTKNLYIGNYKTIKQISSDNDWFDINIIIEIGEHHIPFIDFKLHILERKTTFQLEDGKLFIIPNNWFSEYIDLFSFGKISEKRILLNKIHKGILNNEKDQITFSDPFDNISKDLYKSFDITNLPIHLNATLRNYQKEGFFWLYHLYKNKFGGCLADDMGLGKTLQVITLLEKIREEKNASELFKSTTQGCSKQLNLFTQEENNIDLNGNKTSLIIVPLSIIENWKHEINKFAPKLSTYLHIGTNRTKDVNLLYKNDIILTTYAIVRNDFDQFYKMSFLYLILDEAQHIKNSDTKTFQIINQLNSDYRISLSGTPIENSVNDIWSQMSFLNFNILGSLEFFKQYFSIPIEKEKDEDATYRLKKIITPFILRRTKDMVMQELPPVNISTKYCTMSAMQQDIYEKRKAEIRNLILKTELEGGVKNHMIHFLKGLLQLRLIANSPQLFDNTLENDSGKFDEIIMDLKNIILENHKVLVFSQFVKHINLIRKVLDEEKINYAMIIGSMHAKSREIEIQKFQNSKNCQIFLISLKAGGVGLNLTAADYVFLLDPWWNPAIERQAIDRAHRIGQQKNAFVYKYITKDTVEEKILLLQQKKSEIANNFIFSNNPIVQLTEQDIDDLLN